MSTSRIELLSSRRLNQEFGGGESWWFRQRPHLVAAGVVYKRGRKFWGSLEGVAAWLCGDSHGPGDCWSRHELPKEVVDRAAKKAEVA